MGVTGDTETKRFSLLKKKEKEGRRSRRSYHDVVLSRARVLRVTEDAKTKRFSLLKKKKKKVMCKTTTRGKEI